MSIVDRVWQDLRYGARSLGRTPSVTAAAIVTLALGIGATTTVYSVFEAVLLRRLPVQAPDRLFFVTHAAGQESSTSSNYLWFEQVGRLGEAFDAATAYNLRDFKVSAGDGVEAISGQFVSGNYHAVLGVPFQLGRGFTNESDRTPSPVAVISDRYWLRRFGRQPDALGQSITVGAHLVTIVGVTAPGFDGLQPGRPTDITLPLSLLIQDDPEFLTRTDTWTSMPLVVRVRDGRDVDAERALAATYAQHMQLPENLRFSRGRDGQPRVATLLPAAFGADRLRAQYRRPLEVLMAMVGLVLFIGCVNIANLLLTRAPSRAREMAVRMSMGGSRGRLVAQLLSESVLLACCGGVLGVVLAFWGAEFVSNVFRTGLQPIVVDVQPDGSVLMFAIAVSLATGIAFGLVPAWKTTGIDLAPTLSAGASTVIAGRRRGQLVLIAAQIGLSLVLLFGATLLARSLANLRNFDPGFAADAVVVFDLDARDTRFPRERLEALCRDVVGALAARTDVQAGSCSTMQPIAGNSEGKPVTVPGYVAGPDALPFVWVNTVDPGYFQTLGIPVLRGRAFDTSDSATSTRVAVISETVARHYFGDADPIGRAFSFGRQATDPITIVGVARDARQRLRESPAAMVYTPLSQRAEAPSSVLVAVRTTGETADVIAAVPRTVRVVTGEVAIRYVRGMTEHIGAALVGERLLVALSSSFAVLALVLACVGLYGVMSHDVERRAREIGIRLALGAQRARLVGAVMTRVGVVTMAGLALGAAAALAASRVLTAFLFGLSPTDPLTLLLSVAALGATALLAGYFPARRASRVDPATVLRME